jgi:hypothetical protein
MKIHVVYNAYNEVNLVERSLKTIYPYVDSISIADVAHSNGISVSTDGTHEKIMDFIDERKGGDVKLFYREQKPVNYDYKRNQGIIKTELMDRCDPNNGDWIWVVEADEFYDERSLQNLHSRYILNHQALKHDKRWISVTMLNFAYDLHHCFFGWSGRFFRYRYGAKFDICNKFMWGSSLVYDDRYRFEMPAQYMICYHLKYVKPVERLRQRYMFSNNPAVAGKIDWFENVYMRMQSDPEGAYRYNKEVLGNDGFDTGYTGRLFKYDGIYPKHLEDLV